MISKQLKLIILFSLAIVILVGALLLVKLAFGEDGKDKPIELMEGEHEGTAKKVLLIEKLQQKDIYSITVSNSSGSFTFINDIKNSLTYLENFEEYPISKEMTDSLYKRVSSFYVERVEIEPSDISKYGLDASANPAFVEITKFDNSVFKIYFGLESADGASYYIMCEGRNIVYKLSNSNVENTVFAKVENYISTLVVPILEDVSYVNIEQITIRKNGKDFVSFEKVSDDYKEKTGYALTHKMTFPTNYLVNITNFEVLLNSFSSLYGTEVIGFGYAKNNDFKKLSEYGFDKNLVEINYTFSGVPSYIYVGGKTEDGLGYYVYSLYFDTLLVISTDSLPFINWELGDYIGKSIFQMSINYVEKIEIQTKDNKTEFVLFDKDKKLTVTANGKKLKNDINGDCANFRQFYKNLIRITWDGYSGEVQGSYDLMLRIKVTTRFGEVFDYSFYQISTLRCMLIYNGNSEFYTEKATLDNFISNFNKVLNNETIELEF